MDDFENNRDEKRKADLKNDKCDGCHLTAEFMNKFDIHVRNKHE